MDNKFSLSNVFKPTGLLVYLPLIFPLYLIKFDLLNIPLNVLEVLVLILFAWFSIARIFKMWSEYIVADKKLWLKLLWDRNKRFFGLTLVFLLISVIAVLIVPKETRLFDGNNVYESKKVALGIFKGWIVIPYMYFTMLWFGLKKKSELFTSLYAYLFSILPLALWAFYQYFSGNFITMDGRASGPFINANYLAMYLVPAVVALWILIVRGVLLGFKFKRFLIGMILAIIYTVALLMTHSYAAIMAVVAALVVFLILTFRLHARFGKALEIELLKKIAYFLGVFAVIGLVAGLVLFVETEKWKLFTEFQARSSASVRLQVYQIDQNFVLNNPWLGIGFGQFQPKYDLESRKILGHEPYELIMIHPHDTFIAVWLNLGLIGVILFIGLIVVIFIRFNQTVSYSEKFYRMIGLSMLIAMLLHGIVDTYIFKNDLVMIFWLIVALCLLPRKFVIEGKVLEGERLGRTIGFPTANLEIFKSNLDLTELQYGVYGGRVWVDGKAYVGAISYGLRPTVDVRIVPTFEVFIVDFSDNIYGKVIKVEIACFVRSIFKFKNMDELKLNITNDLKVIQSKVRI